MARRHFRRRGQSLHGLRRDQVRIHHSAVIFFCVLILSANVDAQTTTAYAFIGQEKAKGIGVLHLAPGRQWSFGLDLAVEGKRDDFSGGGYSEEDSWSVNAVIGFSAYNGTNWSIAPFGLIGARVYETSCPYGQSYLGYQCYADTDPDNDWKLNAGGGLLIGFRRVVAGVRITGESTTAVAGVRF